MINIFDNKRVWVVSGWLGSFERVKWRREKSMKYEK